MYFWIKSQCLSSILGACLYIEMISITKNVDLTYPVSTAKSSYLAGSTLHPIHCTVYSTHCTCTCKWTCIFTCAPQLYMVKRVHINIFHKISTFVLQKKSLNVISHLWTASILTKEIITLKIEPAPAPANEPASAPVHSYYTLNTVHCTPYTYT